MILPVKKIGSKVEICSPGVPDSLLSVKLEQALFQGKLPLISSTGKTGASSSKAGSGEQVVRPSQQGGQGAVAAVSRRKLWTWERNGKYHLAGGGDGGWAGGLGGRGPQPPAAAIGRLLISAASLHT